MNVRTAIFGVNDFFTRATHFHPLSARSLGALLARESEDSPQRRGGRRGQPDAPRTRVRSSERDKKIFPHPRPRQPRTARAPVALRALRASAVNLLHP